MRSIEVGRALESKVLTQEKLSLKIANFQKWGGLHWLKTVSFVEQIGGP